MSNPIIFDHDIIEQFRQRAFKRHGKSADFLLNYIAQDLQERLQTVDRQFLRAVDLHGHTGAAVGAMQNSGKVKTIERVETQAFFAQEGHKFYQRGREILDLPTRHFDLIVSLLSLHMTNDVPGVLTQIKNSLKPDGLFLAVMPGAGTLGELRESLLQAETELYGGASPRVYPFADLRDAGALLQRVGFAMPVSDVESLTVRYNNVFDLMRDIRAMGMQNSMIDRSRRPLTKTFFMRVAEIYADRFSDPDGRIRASFSFIWLSGWAPDESQQKPAKPGSAKVSLADVLEDKSNS